MSTTLDTIYKKLAPSLEQNGAGHSDPARQISPVVAHELNNIITIIMGYGERLLFKNGGDPETAAHLKLIVEAARRAGTIVRDATPASGIKSRASANVNGSAPKELVQAA